MNVIETLQDAWLDGSGTLILYTRAIDQGKGGEVAKAFRAYAKKFPSEIRG